MPQCHNCDSFITAQFARVFGNNEDNVYACPECSVSTEFPVDNAVEVN